MCTKWKHVSQWFLLNVFLLFRNQVFRLLDRIFLKDAITLTARNTAYFMWQWMNDEQINGLTAENKDLQPYFGLLGNRAAGAAQKRMYFDETSKTGFTVYNQALAVLRYLHFHDEVCICMSPGCLLVNMQIYTRGSARSTGCLKCLHCSPHGSRESQSPSTGSDLAAIARGNFQASDLQMWTTEGGVGLLTNTCHGVLSLPHA